MNSKRRLIIVFSLLLIIGIISSCNKYRDDEPISSIPSESEIISKINNFTPDRADYATVYRSFVSEKKLFAENTRSGAADQRIDTARWNIETYLNSEYGFRIDTGYFDNQVIDTILITINSYDDGIPVVDGDELASFLEAKEDIVSDENSNQDSLYFWSGIVTVGGIVSGQVQVITALNSHLNFKGVYPPGWDPEDFPHYSCMKAFTWAEHECGGDTWKGGANKQYIRKVRSGCSMNGNYIMVLVNTYFKGPVGNGVNGRLWYINEFNPYYVLETSNGDELCDFLQSTKDLIDDLNPNGSFNLYIGNCYIDIYYDNVSYPQIYGHMLIYKIWEKVYIGYPD